MSKNQASCERTSVWVRAGRRSWSLATEPGRLLGRYGRGDLDLGFHPGVMDSPTAASTLIGVIALLGSVTIGTYALLLPPGDHASDARGFAVAALAMLVLAVVVLTLRHRVTRPIRHAALIVNVLVLQALVVMAPELSSALLNAQGCVVIILMAYSLLPVRQSLPYPLACIAITSVSVSSHPGLTSTDIVIAVVNSLLWLIGLHWIAMSALTSETDALTRVHNAHGFKRRLSACLRPDLGHSTTIIVIDLDHFAVTNEALRADLANEVLVRFTAECANIFPPCTVIARTDGDEFGLILPSNSADEAVVLLQRLRPLVHGFSAGVAASEAGESASEMITHAQDALHVAKRGGRGVTRVHGGHYAGAAVVSQAIVAGEFFLEYQPVVDLRTRRVVGAEALVRWQHPTRGRISPEDFIPLCETSGSIVLLGQWVLSQAVQAAAAWRIPAEPGHPDFFIGVNAAGQEFADPHYAERALAACRAADLPPGALTIELTESAYGIDADVVYDNLRMLQQAGIPVAIDDFGTGFANLERLSLMHANVLKIDRRFVADIRGSDDEAPLVQIIIGLATALNSDVIAEGIETEEQAVWLEEHGCVLGQGYLFSRPVRGDTFLSACAAIPRPQA